VHAPGAVPRLRTRSRNVGGEIPPPSALKDVEPHTVQLVALPERCYRCGGITRGIVGVLVAGRRGHVFREFDDVAVALSELLDADVLRSVHIGRIKQRRSRVRGTYLSNGCVHCDAILGSFPLWEGLQEFLSEGGELRDLVVRVRVSRVSNAAAAPVQRSPRLTSL